MRLNCTSPQLDELEKNSPAAGSDLMPRATDKTFYKAPSDGNTRSTIFWATLVALAVRLVVVGFTYQSFLDPGRDHWEFGYEMGQIARSIVTGHGFSNPYTGVQTGPTAVISPVFPYLMAGVMMVFGIFTKAAALAMLTLDSLFSALTCVPIFFLAKRSFGLRVARWATWVWAFFPYAVYASAGSMWDHPLTTLLLTLLFLIALQLEKPASLWTWAGYGLLWGLAALTSPIVLGVFPVLVGWACYRLHRQGRRWVVSAGVLVLVLMVTITPWLVRNYRTFHKPVFLRTGFPVVFVVGNVGNALHWYNPLDPPGSAAAMAEYQRVGEQAYMTARWRDVVSFLREHPQTFVWRSLRRAVYLWTGYWSLDPEYLREEPFDPPNIFFCTIFTSLALLGLRQAFRTAADVALPFALLLLVFPIAYYFTMPYLFYRHPLDPAMVILASYAVVSWRRSRRKQASAAGS